MLVQWQLLLMYFRYAPQAKCRSIDVVILFIMGVDGALIVDPSSSTLRQLIMPLLSAALFSVNS